MPEPVDPQEYARMRAIATELWPLADHLEGFWGVEIGRAGPFVMMSPRYERIRDYVFGDAVPFGAWRIDTSAFRRYGS